jgi:Mor family transcriptional regulator
MRKIKPGNMAVKRSKFYTELAGHIRYFCESRNLPQEFNDKFTDDIVEFIAVAFGGQNITFPVDAAYYTGLRDIDIYNDFMVAGNYFEVAAKYGFTERGIRKVIDRIREQLKNNRKKEGAN